MNIAISFTNKEHPLLSLLIEQIKRTSTPIERASHPVHLFSSNPIGLREFQGKLVEIGMQVRTHVTPDKTIGWPAGPNFAFRLAAKEMEAHGDYFYFLEPDHCPIKMGWLTKLQNAIDALTQGKQPLELPIIGTIQKTVVAGEQEQIRHVNGAALYPANTYSRFAELLSWTPDVLAWDVYCPATSKAWAAIMVDLPEIHLAWKGHSPKRTHLGIEYKLEREVERDGVIPDNAIIVHGFKNRDIFDMVNATSPLPKKRGRPKKTA